MIRDEEDAKHMSSLIGSEGRLFNFDIVLNEAQGHTNYSNLRSFLKGKEELLDLSNLDNEPTHFIFLFGQHSA